MSMTPNLTPDKTGSQSEKSDESVDDPRIDVDDSSYPMTKTEVCRML